LHTDFWGEGEHGGRRSWVGGDRKENFPG
jgi:hypothetical protein